MLLVPPRKVDSCPSDTEQDRELFDHSIASFLGYSDVESERKMPWRSAFPSEAVDVSGPHVRALKKLIPSL
jgi:hypothetical protein